MRASVEKAARYYATLGYGSFASGNADGGLTTIEEKSLGAYMKSGQSMISGLIKPGDIPPKGGLYLMDVVPDGEVRFGFPNISDNAEIVEMMASGAHCTLFVTGRGSVVGSAIAPVIETPHGPTQAEVRIMYVWTDRLRAVLPLIRMGRGQMMGVAHNRGLAWVGASAGFSVAP